MTMEDEMIGAANLVAAAYERLNAQNSGHELLKYVKITRKSIKISDEHVKEFDEKFSDTNRDLGGRGHDYVPEICHPIFQLVRYERALSEAAKN